MALEKNFSDLRALAGSTESRVVAQNLHGGIDRIPSLPKISFFLVCSVNNTCL